MALRVTRPKAAPVDPREAAIAALAREDLAAYRTLFADTAAIPSFHARYGARRAMLEEEPREPVFLNSAGVALYELGSWAAAEALFRAAFRLSPTLPHVRENLDALVARRRAGRRPALPPP